MARIISMKKRTRYTEKSEILVLCRTTLVALPGYGCLEP